MIARLAERAGWLGLDPQWLLWRDAPGGLDKPGLVSANRHCRLLRTADGWAALNLARPDDVEVVPGLGCGEGWEGAETAARGMASLAFRDAAVELQLPVALPGEASPMNLAMAPPTHVPRRVLDMSALWAGPLCAGLLARAGAEVVRVESLGRPDPTPASSPILDRRINGAKQRIALDLRTAEGRDALLRQIDLSDVFVTSARAGALARLGIDRVRLAGKTWVAITGHGLSSQRVGFGDDCAVAGGLLHHAGCEPAFLGDALADPLTGLEAALMVLSGATGILDVAMARVAAAYADQ